jgi:anti-anti-sigma factor
MERENNPVTVLRLEGDLDAQTGPELIDKATDLVADGNTNILLDLSRVRYMGSAGLLAMHTIDKRLKETQSGQLKLLNPSDPVKKVLNALQDTTFFEIYDKLDSALKAF